MNIQEMEQELNRLQAEKEALEDKATSSRYSTVQLDRFAWQLQQIGGRIGQLQYSIKREYELNSPMMQLAAQVADQLKQKEEAAAAKAEADRQARIKASAQAAFLRDGGAPENFEFAWIGIKANLAAAAALQAAAAALQAEQAGGDIRQIALNALREKYGSLPSDGEFLRPSFLGRDAFANLEAAYTPADDVPVDSIAEVA